MLVDNEHRINPSSTSDYSIPSKSKYMKEHKTNMPTNFYCILLPISCSIDVQTLLVTFHSRGHHFYRLLGRRKLIVQACHTHMSQSFIFKSSAIKNLTFKYVLLILVLVPNCISHTFASFKVTKSQHLCLARLFSSKWKRWEFLSNSLSILAIMHRYLIFYVLACIVTHWGNKRSNFISTRFAALSVNCP